MTAGRGRSLAAPSPSLAADAGRADSALVAALAESDVSAVHQALSAARVFVPVAASLVSADATGADKESDMALLLLDGTSGQALPVFSSVEALAAWDDGRVAGARPVAVSGADALAHAVEEKLAAVVVDVAGAHPAVLELIAAPTYRPGSWAAGKRLMRALRRSGAAEAYLLDVGTADTAGRPAIGLVLPRGARRCDRRTTCRCSGSARRPGPAGRGTAGSGTRRRRHVCHLIRISHATTRTSVEFASGSGALSPRGAKLPSGGQFAPAGEFAPVAGWVGEGLILLR